MQKTSQLELDPQLDPRNAPLLKKAEELRVHLLSNGGIRERISFRAYELYERRGFEQGLALEDWAQAERELLSPLIEQELKRSRETSQEAGQKRDASETAERGIKLVPQKQTIPGAIHKSEVARTKKTKPRF
jgi:hypothetical protein